MKFAFFSHGISSRAIQKLSKLTGKRASEISILYITTPANPYGGRPDWLIETLDQLEIAGFRITTFDLEQAYKQGIDTKDLLEGKDIVFVSGGNAFYFLYWVKKTGFKSILKKFLERGGVYAGESAGAVCMIKDMTPIAWADKPDLVPEIINRGLQLTNIICIPHWENMKYHETLVKIKKYYEKNGSQVYTIRDNEALFCVDGVMELIK